MQYCNDIYQQLFGCSYNKQKSPPFMFLGTRNLLILQQEQKKSTQNVKRHAPLMMFFI